MPTESPYMKLSTKETCLAASPYMYCVMIYPVRNA